MKDWPSYLDLPKPQPKPQTQFDHLRAMSDEELAFDRVEYKYGVRGSCDEGEYFTGDFEPPVHIRSMREKDWNDAREEALKRELEWGRSPYKEEQP